MSDTPIHVRPAAAADTERLVDFNCRLAAETEDKTLDRDVVRRGVMAVLAEPARGRYRVAERDGRVVGALAVTVEWSDWRDGEWWWLQSVYVVAEARRSGVFAALWAELEREARERPEVLGLRLYVEHDNTTAQATYRRVGMQPLPYHLYQKLLRPGALD